LVWKISIYWYEKYQYIGMKNINILKRNCQVGINVVFLEVILKLYDVCFIKSICIASWTCLHRFDLHIITRWHEKCQEDNQDMFTLWSFYTFCRILYYFSAVNDSLWLLVTLMLLQNMKINHLNVLLWLV
jgi:hypothetical protein